MRHQRRGTSGPGAQQLPEAEDFQGELSIGGSQDDESCSGGQLTEETRVREVRARRRRALQAGEGPALSHNALLCVANKGFRNANCDLWTLCSGCSGRQEAPRIRTGTLSVWSRSASMQDVPEEWREERGGDGRTGGPEGKKKKKKGEESLMMELTRLVQEAVEGSSWWERRGIDCSILAAAFLCLPPAFLLLGSSQVLLFSAGMLLMGAAHAVIAFKGTHLASHGALSESQAWGNFWAVFFIEVCGSFSARVGVQGHIKMHHAHTNVVGLGDSSVWKVPCLPRAVYLFVAPLAVPVITPLVALAHLRGHPVAHVVRTVLMVALGLYSQYWLLIHVSGFLSPLSALLCMLACRAMFSVPYIHVNIFQHIGLHMFAPTSRPKRIYQMTHGVLNLPRNALLDWMCGHSLISCHVEHHLFPFLSDNMCLKVKPLVSKYLMEKQLPYQEDGYFSRLAMFFHKYQELMVFAPPITELVGVQ